MKSFFLFVLFGFICFLPAQSQEQLRWPVKGKNPGENILYRPNDYIFDEHNFNDLYIKTTEKDTIIAPCDGTIIMFKYSYNHKINCSLSGFSSTGKNDQETRKSIAKELQTDLNKTVDPKYINITIGISTPKGEKYYISGLRLLQKLKTGYAIKKGDIIGTAGYVYKEIKHSCISISRSIKSISADPMSPFGLKTTFIPLALKEKKQMTVREMQEDIQILVNALKEGYPGLYDYISANELDSITRHLFEKHKKPVSIHQFELLLKSIIGQLHDSHLTLLPHPSNQRKMFSYYPSISFGWLNDCLIVNPILIKEGNPYGKQIVEVDGIPADSLKTIIENYLMYSTQQADGFSKSLTDFRLLTAFEFNYFQYYPKASKKCDVELKFADGKLITFNGMKPDKSKLKILPGWLKFCAINRNKNKSFTTDTLPNKTAYLGLSTFELNEIEVEQVSNFIKSISDSSYKHLIIDVRNNAGGDEKVLSHIFSLITENVFQMDAYKKVNKVKGFEFFKYTTNYSPEESSMYLNYKKVPEKEGYFLFNDSIHKPHPTINFNGRIYVLVNERSFSASTLLSALVHKYKRGVVIGKETPTTYHQMNASDFANLRLPNSLSTIRIPLVQGVFDTIDEPGIPRGRGVIPDYPVDLSIKEISFENGDSILNYTLDLIKHSKYLPAKAEENQDKSGEQLFLLIFGSAIITTFILAISKKKKEKKISN